EQLIKDFVGGDGIIRALESGEQCGNWFGHRKPPLALTDYREICYALCNLKKVVQRAVCSFHFSGVCVPLLFCYSPPCKHDENMIAIGSFRTSVRPGVRTYGRTPVRVLF